MNAYQEDIRRSLETHGRAEAVTVRNTNWGFSISEVSGHAGLIEVLAKAFGVAMAPTGALLILLPGVGSRIQGVPIQLGITLAFFLVGLAVFAYAVRGFRTELQVDTARGQFRLGTVNQRNLFAVRNTYPTSEIESVFLARAKDGRNTAQLFLRIKPTSEKVYVLTGSEQELVPVLELIVEAVRKRSRHRQSRTKTTGRFIHATFS